MVTSRRLYREAMAYSEDRPGRGTERFEAIVERYGERQAMELILCCAYFNMLSRVLESARVPLEEKPVLGQGE